MQAAGAALGTLVAEIAVLIVQFIAMRREIKELVSGLPVLNILISIAGALLCSVWVLSRTWGNVLSLLVSGVLFFAAYYAVMLARRDEMAVYLLRTVLGKLNRKKEQYE